MFFSLSTPSNPSGGLCSYLTLSVTGEDSTTPYVDQTAGIGAISATALNNSAGVALWHQNDDNVFTFAVGVTSAFGASSSGAVGQSCTFSALFTQAG